MDAKGVYSFLKEFDFLLNMGYKFYGITPRGREPSIGYRNEKKGIHIDFEFMDRLDVNIYKISFGSPEKINIKKIYPLYNCEDYTNIFPPEDAISHVARFIKKNLIDFLEGKGWEEMTKKIRAYKMKEKTFISFYEEVNFLFSLDYKFTDINLFIPAPYIIMKNKKLNIKISFLFMSYGLKIIIQRRKILYNKSFIIDEPVYEYDETNYFKCTRITPIQFMKNNYLLFLKGKD